MKKLILKISIVLLILVGIGGTVWSTTELSAAGTVWDSCRKGRTNCYYPGACHDYVDTNGDNICDKSQSNPDTATASSSSSSSTTSSGTTQSSTSTEVDSSTSVVAAVIETDVPGGDTAELNEVEDTAVTTASTESTVVNKYTYYLVPILLISALLYGTTWLLAARKKIAMSTHRKIWNSALLVYALVSCLLGILLVVRIETGFNPTLPFDILFWHVEAGIAMSVVTIFHIIWHRKYFSRLFNGVNKTTPAGS